MMTSKETLERFGKYFLLDKIGSGGMAEIFRARPATIDANGRILVIKRVLRKVATDPEFLDMFRSEIQVCMGLNHPNIVQIHDFGDVARQTYLAMEFVEGLNLKDLVIGFSEENERIPIEMACLIIEQASRGLHYAHNFLNSATGESLQIVHRDISPHNILVSYTGSVKVIDFGIAKASIQSRQGTRDGIIKGKLRYLSPEMVDCKEPDRRSDIFSLGIVLWELLTGRKLFYLSGATDVQILQTILNCDTYIEPPSVHNPKIPAELDGIVMKALKRERGARYQSAEDLGTALRLFLANRHPGYSALDAARKIQQIFRRTMEKDRFDLLELNQKAQVTLSKLGKSSKSASSLFPAFYPSVAKKPKNRSFFPRHALLASATLLGVAVLANLGYERLHRRPGSALPPMNGPAAGISAIGARLRPGPVAIPARSASVAAPRLLPVQFEIHPPDPHFAATIWVNGTKLEPGRSTFPVPMHQRFTVAVRRPGYKLYQREILLAPNVIPPPGKSILVKIPLSR